ncbi:MAG: FAD-binding oxidoreductase [Gaiellaceae bacterium]
MAALFSGRLLRPGDEGYEEARRVHNGLIDKRPALIARCHGTADVVDAVALARESGLEISIRGGGHSIAGRAATDGGLMIDLAEMKGIHVDPLARTIRTQGGVTWAEFNRESAVHGLATPGGTVSTTGIAGLTLGGGIGWLSGVHGLAADNVLSIELVTAEGDVLTVTADSHPDLFWALRGGGGNFGVATSFEYRLYPLREVVGGVIAYPFDAARDVLRFYRDTTQSYSDELGIVCGLIHAPDGSGTKLAAFAICHAGSREQAEQDLSPLRAFGEPVLMDVGPMPYPVVNTLFDAAYPRGALNYWKSSFLKSLDDELIDLTVEAFASTPSPMTLVAFEHFHGAVTRVGVTDTPVPHREVGHSVLITSVWTDHGETDENVTWTRAAYEAMRPFFVDRRWLNYFSDDDRAEATHAAYGPNYDRLVEVKRRYDRENVFRLNQNIAP